MVNMKLIRLFLISNLKKRKVFSITIFLLTVILIAVGTSTLSAIEGNGTIYEERYAKHKGPDQLLSFSNESYDKDLKGDLEKNKKIFDFFILIIVKKKQQNKKQKKKYKNKKKKKKKG